MCWYGRVVLGHLTALLINIQPGLFPDIAKPCALRTGVCPLDEDTMFSMSSISQETVGTISKLMSPIEECCEDYSIIVHITINN